MGFGRVSCAAIDVRETFEGKGLKMKKDYSEYNATDIFCKTIVDTQYDDIDPVLFERMKVRLADGIGVTLAGYHGVGVDKLVKLMLQYAGAEESTVFNYGVKLPALNAAMVNSMQMRSNDNEPCHADNKTGEGSPTHIASALNPTAFAVGEREHASGKRVMTAIAVAEDLGCRLNDAMNFNTYNVFDGTGTVNGMVNTACAGKLNGLNAEEMHRAFSIAINCINGSMASTLEHTMLFKFPTANSARNGIFAADLARAGFEGRIVDPIAGTRGFFDMFAESYEAEKLFDRVGEKRYGEILIKPFAGCCATHHQIKATLLATGGKAYDPSEIREIRCHMLAGKVGIVGSFFEAGEDSQAHSPFSTQATVCNAVLHGGVYAEYETAEMLGGEKFQEMLTKYVQIPDLEVSDEDWSRVEVELVDGTILRGNWSRVRPGMMTDSAPLSMASRTNTRGMSDLEVVSRPPELKKFGKCA